MSTPEDTEVVHDFALFVRESETETRVSSRTSLVTRSGVSMGLFGRSVQLFRDSDLNAVLHDVIKSARKQLVIVSPYVDPGLNLVAEMVAATRSDVSVELIIRRDKESEYRRSTWLPKLAAAGIVIRSVERLHAKVYMNEEEVLIGSANFSEDSWSNSRELCVSFGRSSKEGEEIAEYVDRLRDDSQLVSTAAETKQRKSDGHCIGCAESLPLNAQRPSCRACYPKIADGGRGEFCHRCGTSAKTSLEKPQCYACFKQGAAA